MQRGFVRCRKQFGFPNNGVHLRALDNTKARPTGRDLISQQFDTQEIHENQPCPTLLVMTPSPKIIVLFCHCKPNRHFHFMKIHNSSSCVILLGNFRCVQAGSYIVGLAKYGRCQSRLYREGNEIKEEEICTQKGNKAGQKVTGSNRRIDKKEIARVNTNEV